MEKLPFFRAAMAGLGIYHTGGYGRIGVYRVNGLELSFCSTNKHVVTWRYNYDYILWIQFSCED